MARISVVTLACIAGLTGALALASCGESADSASNTNNSTETNDSDGSDPDTLTIARIPSEEETQVDQAYAKIAEILEQETGKDVDFQQATSYAAVIEAQRAGQVQIAAHGPFSYVVATDSDAGAELIGYRADSPDDPSGYRSVASVPGGSDITDLSEFEGKNICFIDPTSTSGFLFPSAGLLEEGVDPSEDVNPIFAGGHDASVLAIADGQCDGGFSTIDMATEQLIESGQIEEGDIEVIWQSELIPPSPLAVSTQLSPELREEIKSVFLDRLNVDALQESGDCDESEDNCGLPSEWGFLPIEDSEYDGIRRVCETTEADSCDV